MATAHLPPDAALTERSRERRIWLLISAACVVPAALTAFQSLMQAQLEHEPVSWKGLVFGSGDWLFLGALTPLVYYVARRVPLQRAGWKRMLAAHLAGALGLCVGWTSLGIGLGLLLHSFPVDGPLGQSYLRWLLISLPWSVFMYLLVLGCVYAFTYFNEARQREAQASRLAAQLAEARLGALRMQLHPHFLFNSLNAVSVLVRERDPASALRMLELLGDVLRKVLRSEQRNEVPLAEELEFLEEYLAIEQVRFSDRLRVQWTIEEAARAAVVPSLLLQPLVENAIQHGVAKRAEAGRIEIAARVAEGRLILSVADDGVGMGPEVREGVGLANTRERLRTLYGSEATLAIASVPGQGTRITLTLPLRERKA